MLEEGEQLVGWAVAAGPDSWRRGPVERPLLDGLVGVDVDLGCFGVLVPEPERNHGDVDAGLQQCHGGGMPQHVGRDSLAAQRGGRRLCGSGVPGHEKFDGVPAEGPAAAGGDQRAGRLAADLFQPGPQQPGDLRGERGAAFLAALAGAPDVGAGAEVDVGAGERGELGDPQPGLDGEREQGMVAPAYPAGAVGCGEHCFCFRGRQIAHRGFFEPGGRDGQDPLDVVGVLGMAQRRVAE